MILSSTGIGYLILSFGLAIIAYRCLETTKTEKGGNAARLFSYFFTIFSLIAFILSLISFLGSILDIKKIFLLLYTLLAVGCAVLGYLNIYLKAPKTSPWLGFVPILMVGTIVIFLGLFQGQPSITESGGINWGLSPLGYILLFSLFLFTFLITSQRDFRTETK
ncbi:MAG: hypothetical protein V1705_00810 [bacterium]